MNKYLSICVIGALFISCIGSGGDDSKSAQDNYKTLSVKRQNYILKRKLTVKVESQHNVDVRPLVAGRIVKMYVQDGAQVKKGQALFVVEQEPYIAAVNAAKAHVNSARASLSTAQLNLDGKEQLFAKKMVSEIDVQRARYAKDEAAALLKAAEAELAEANANFKYTTTCSPVDGVISMILYREGNLIYPSMEKPMLTIATNNKLYAYSCFSEEILSGLLEEYSCSTREELIEKMPDVTLYTIWGEELPQKGRIDAIDGSVDVVTGAIDIRASFDNTSELFRNGSNGYIYLPYMKNDVIVIPKDAAFRIQNKYFVYRIVDGKASQTEIKINPYNNDDNYVVTTGLDNGDIIVAENVGKVKEGMTITKNINK
jgi:membrane fusion protein (multidrug efflux system)